MVRLHQGLFAGQARSYSGFVGAGLTRDEVRYGIQR